MRLSDERGSLAPLGIGLLALLLTSSLLISLASDLLLSQRRIESLAESIALASYEEARALELPDVPTSAGAELAGEYLTVLQPHPAGEIRLAELWLANDGTLTVRLCGSWQAPFRVLSLASSLEICAQALARSGEGSDQ